MLVRESDHIIELSERNLRALLAKLDGHPPNSACSIARDGWLVVGVRDDQHYRDRHPGAVHPCTLRHLAEQ